jgi:Integrase core domain
LTKAASAIGDVIHTDIVGPLPPTLLGYKYVLSFIDGKTRLMHIYLLTKKSEAGAKLKEFVTNFERKHEVKVKTVHGDNAGEFTGGTFNKYLREHGIEFTSSAQYSPESNGLVKISTVLCSHECAACCRMLDCRSSCGVKQHITRCLRCIGHQFERLEMSLPTRQPMEERLTSASCAYSAVMHLCCVKHAHVSLT